MKINTEKSDYEDFGDEIVFINIESGSYYTLKGFILNVIRILKKGCTDSGLDKWLEEYCQDENERKKTQAILDELKQSELLSDSSDGKGLENFQPHLNLGNSEFKRFDDMQDLIKLDPIHDVDTQGWPQKKE